jgi:hypothetical protein
MRGSINLIVFQFLILTSLGCGQQEPVNRVYAEADSVLALTLALQSRIGSPEIQRMHVFREEIGMDISTLPLLESTDPSIIRYLELYEGLGRCMKACNQFHEEAFMLESSLRDIMEQSLQKDANVGKLEELLSYETENYKDLHIRADSSLVVANRQAEIFYQLKPEINKIKEEAQRP